MAPLAPPLDPLLQSIVGLQNKEGGAQVLNIPVPLFT